MSAPRVWLNRTFATARHTTAALQASHGAIVHVSHPGPDSPSLLGAATTSGEPVGLDGPTYARWALRQCRARSIDVLVPGAHAHDLALVAEELSRSGTTLMCAPAATIDLYADKARTYAAMAAADVVVPDHETFSDRAGLAAAMEAMAARGERHLVVKPARGVGAAGFRVLDERAGDLEHLLGPAPILAPAALSAALGRAEGSGAALDLQVLMPYLAGPEVSVDALCDADGAWLGAVTRTKVGRRRVVGADPGALALARAVLAAHPVPYLSNVQARWWTPPGGRRALALLEVNARASAGIHQCAAGGVDLAGAALDLALGRCVDPASLLAREVVVVPVQDVVVLG